MHWYNLATPVPEPARRLVRPLLRHKRLLVVGGLALLAAAPLVHGWNPGLLVFNLVGLGIGLAVARRIALNRRNRKLSRRWDALNRQNLELREQELAERRERLARRHQHSAQNRPVQEAPA